MHLAKELTPEQIKWHIENATHHLNVLRETMRVKRIEAFPFISKQDKDKINTAIAKVNISNDFLQDFITFYVTEIEALNND